jgi:hypothetical protein
MKKSKSLFGRLQNGGLYLRHPVDTGGAFADVHIENRLTEVHRSRTNSLRPLRNQRRKNSVNLCSSVAETQSIKNNKLCKTNPISKKPKMNLNHYTTNDYENKSGLLTPGKQTQSNPILSAVLSGVAYLSAIASAKAEAKTEALAKADSKGEVGGIFEEFSCEVEELCGISTVGNFVVHGQRHTHQLANYNAAIVRDTGIGYSADAEDTALAGDNYWNKRVYSKDAEVADGNAGAFEVGEQ